MGDIITERNLKGGLASPKTMGGCGRVDFYKYYKKNGGKLPLLLFGNIIRECNFALADEIIENAEDFTLPYGMGRISFRKRKNILFASDTGIKTTAGVDWKKTMALWESNPKAKEKKIRIHYSNLENGKYAFRIMLFLRKFENKEFFAFKFKRSFKRKFATRIKTYNKPKIEVEITKNV